MTTLELKRIKEEYANGREVKDIAAEKGVSATTIYRCVKNVQRKEEPKAGLVKNVAEDYLSGKYSLKEVLQKYGISSSCLYNYLDKYAVTKYE